MNTLIAIFYFLIVVIFDIRLQAAFEVPKWAIYYGFVASSIVLFIFFQKTEIHYPQFKKSTFFIIMGMVITYLLSMAFNWPGNYSADLIDWTAFLLGIFFVYQWSMSDSLNKYGPLLNANAVVTFVVIGITFLSFFGIAPTFINEWKVFWSQYSLFGNLNNCAEFLGFSIGLQILSLSLLKDKYHLRKGLIAFSFIMFFFYLSRSLSIALAVSLLAYIPMMRKFWKKILLGGAIITTVILLLNVLPLIYKENSNLTTLSETSLLTGSYVKSQKEKNVSSRYNMLLNTLMMVKDNPLWGVGPAKFQFSYIPYLKSAKQDHIVTETMISRSPHNSYLEATVESGIPFGIFIFILLFVIYRKVFENISNNPDPLKKWVAFSAIFFTVDGLFNFPLEIPFPFMALALILGIGLSQFTETRTMGLKNWGKLVLSGFGLLLIVHGYRFYFSHYVLYRYPLDHSKLSEACSMYPRNWKTCIHKAEVEIKLKMFQQAQQTIIKELKVNPFNIAALKALSIVYLNTNQRVAGCHLISMYIDFFAGETSLDLIKKEYCSEIKEE